MRTLRATRNEHDWTCTVPWRVFPLRVKNTADDNDNDARGRDNETNVREHMPRDSSAVEASGPKAQGSYKRDVRGSDQTSLLPEVSRRTSGS